MIKKYVDVSSNGEVTVVKSTKDLVTRNVLMIDVQDPITTNVRYVYIIVCKRLVGIANVHLAGLDPLVRFTSVNVHLDVRNVVGLVVQSVHDVLPTRIWMT